MRVVEVDGVREAVLPKEKGRIDKVKPGLAEGEERRG